MKTRRRKAKLATKNIHKHKRNHSIIQHKKPYIWMQGRDAITNQGSSMPHDHGLVESMNYTFLN